MDSENIVAYRASEYRTGQFTEDERAAALTEGTDPSRNGLVLPFDTMQITSKGNYSRPKAGDPCHPLAKGAHPPSVAKTLPARGDGSPCADRGPNMVAPQAIPRRLTPRECERLQGFPDDWTAWGVDEDGERVEIADTPRYRMLGNAVTVPVAEWIGRRLMQANP